ncbi:Tripartite ATP-independent periplasmic transporter DctQ component [Desulfofundulus kuznetsovii DSM 6115]|uniref:Tripartite ATP-independent periplasmic transporter DctQ component n=1 Tax=Desulfofundulus kuznetsovii (strain DSM 6115 / VKM B-1805 / 17) TaxID=760568 RepID=A0AAU8PQM4_DESK7|nr:Tripartite ATP-independent periplasmic transporter DctQ component [Desulfofundulus kuznetsovii DSM 6115]
MAAPLLNRPGIVRGGVMILVLEKKLGVLSEALHRLSRVVLGIVVIIMLSAILLQVFCRYVLNSPLRWPEELTTFLMAWMSFVGAAVALKEWQHIGVDVFINLFRGKVKIAMLFIVRVLVLVFVIFLLKQGVALAITSIPLLSDGMRISMFWPRLSVPVGSALMLIHTIHLILQDIVNFATGEVA